ncbi:hypothetical protein AAG570_013207 [Ranatra chinensis]|uniref:RNA-directed DNA polymerase n=1 Tax=Ranatra chinensis TaxID=642074 RepID=A0ABD0YGL5_9HEMI
MEAILVAIDDDKDEMKAMREERDWMNAECGRHFHRCRSHRCQPDRREPVTPGPSPASAAGPETRPGKKEAVLDVWQLRTSVLGMPETKTERGADGGKSTSRAAWPQGGPYLPRASSWTSLGTSLDPQQTQMHPGDIEKMTFKFERKDNKVAAVKELPVLKDPKTAQEEGKVCPEALVTVPILRYPNFAQPFILMTNASGVAFGAVLLQVENGEDRRIANASRWSDEPRQVILDTSYRHRDRGNMVWEGTLIRWTLTDKDGQDAMIKEYHVGKTNHLGIMETMKHLRRHHYWTTMPKSVASIIGKPCTEAKYERRPEEAP